MKTLAEKEIRERKYIDYQNGVKGLLGNIKFYLDDDHYSLDYNGESVTFSVKLLKIEGFLHYKYL